MSDVSIVAIIFISIYYLIDSVVKRKALHKERMKAMENHVDISNLNLDDPSSKQYSFNALRYGIIAIGFALGVLLGAFLVKSELFPEDMIAYFFSVFLTVGIALITSHYVSKEKE